MTGYGQASSQIGNKSYRIEIKSLNGKTTDIRLKTNANLRDKELELRKMILETACRGKFEVSVIMESSLGEDDFKFNKNLMQSYFNELTSFANENNIDKGDILQSIIRLPNIVQQTDSEMSDEEWKGLKALATEALGNHSSFRIAEGKSLEIDIVERVKNIAQLLKDIEQYEDERITALRDRIKKNLTQYLSKENVDENRFEQEIIFYLEKLDVNEEKVRLAQHCKYYQEQVDLKQIEKGKKLSFITQEMGREINTLGAKAQQSDIQQIVVNMKDELEKIKEQVLNIL
jgi:uncharacterized protein (TIGR00255 family)